MQKQQYEIRKHLQIRQLMCWSPNRHHLRPVPGTSPSSTLVLEVSIGHTCNSPLLYGPLKTKPLEGTLNLDIGILWNSWTSGAPKIQGQEQCLGTPISWSLWLKSRPSLVRLRGGLGAGDWTPFSDTPKNDQDLKLSSCRILPSTMRQSISREPSAAGLLWSLN